MTKVKISACMLVGSLRLLSSIIKLNLETLPTRVKKLSLFFEKRLAFVTSTSIVLLCEGKSPCAL